MSSFLARTFALLGDKPATICAVLGTSRQLMNCSAVPVTLSSDKTYDLLCSKQPETERKLLQLFSTFSDTMQFTEKLRIQNDKDEEFVKGILENLIKKKRYFARTIQLLQLVHADSLIESCCSSHDHSSATTTPILLSNLRSLSIPGGELQSEQLKRICLLCPFLENLSIPCQYQITDDAIECLSSNLKHLNTLNLQYGSITDTGLQHLAKLSSLHSLNVSACNSITDDGLRHLVKLSSLHSLDLGDCSQITDDGLEHIGNMSSLQSLQLYECNMITDDGLEHLAQLPSLQSLDLYECSGITDSGLEHLAQLPSLQSLNLLGCESITDSGLGHLAELLSLQSLTLAFNDNITDSGLKDLAKLLSLKTLDLNSCCNITKNGCRVFSKSTKVIR